MNEEIYYDLIDKDGNPVEPKKGKTGLAVASLVLGIIGLVCCCCGLGYIAAPIALILGIISLVKGFGGKGMAIAGVILSAITAIVLIFFTISCAEYIKVYFKFVSEANEVIQEFEETGELPDYLDQFNGEEYKEFWNEAGFEDFSDYFSQVIGQAKASAGESSESSVVIGEDDEDVIDLGALLIPVQV